MTYLWITVLAAWMLGGKYCTVQGDERYSEEGTGHYSALKAMCADSGISGKPMLLCVQQFRKQRNFRERARRQISHPTACAFCKQMSTRIRGHLLSDEKGNPYMGSMVKQLCDTLIQDKLARSRCYIVKEVVNDPYLLVEDVLSPEICYNMPCPSDNAGRMPKKLVHKMNCQFCEKILRKAKRSIIFAGIMLKRIHKEIEKACTKTLGVKVTRNCMASKKTVNSISTYLQQKFNDVSLCRSINFC